MQFEIHTLGESHLPYVQSVFHYKHFTPDHSIERVVPTGHVFIIFELDGITRNTFHNDSLKPKQEFTGVWVSGMHRNFISISAHQDSEMFVIQFKPGGAYPYFHIDMEAITETVIPAEELFGDEILTLRSAILDGKTPIEKFNVAEQWLDKRLKTELAPDQDLLDVLDALQKEVVTRYAEVISHYPKTQKHLIDQFKSRVGLTPKYFQRILRFNDILARLKNKEKVQWADIAYQSGFSDQSHFIKEFKHFSGFNPQEYIKSDFNKDEPNFFPLDREG
ncbi:MAG: AraC family transcriptional regulator [Bacteroidia bacterium]|nr:AraC family transcriptional regulator [Bacteroidia bacterium]